MRLANMEAMMALIEVLSKFRIVRAPETKVRLYNVIVISEGKWCDSYTCKG